MAKRATNGCSPTTSREKFNYKVAQTIERMQIYTAESGARAGSQTPQRQQQLATSSEAVLRSASDHYDYVYIRSEGKLGKLGKREEKLHVASSQSRANVTKMPRFSFGQLLRANEQQQQKP